MCHSMNRNLKIETAFEILDKRVAARETRVLDY